MLLNNGEIALYVARAQRADPRSLVGKHPRSLRGHVISWERSRFTSGKLSNHPARITDCQHIRGQVPDNNAPGAHDSVVADAHAGADHTRSPEPDVVTNDHGFCSLESTASRVRIERMQRRVNVNSRADLSVVADPNGIAVEEDATVINEAIAANVDIPSVVATER